MNASLTRETAAPSREPIACRLRDLAAARFDGAPVAWVVLGAVAWVAVCLCSVSTFGRHLVGAYANGRTAPFGEAMHGDRDARQLLEMVHATEWPPPHLATFNVVALSRWLDDTTPTTQAVTIAGVTVPLAPLVWYLRTLDVEGIVYVEPMHLRALPRNMSPTHTHLVMRGAGWVIVMEALTPDASAPVFRGLPHLAPCSACNGEIATGHTLAEASALAVKRGARMTSHGAAGVTFTCRSCACRSCAPRARAEVSP